MATRAPRRHADPRKKRRTISKPAQKQPRRAGLFPATAADEAPRQGEDVASAETAA